MVLSSSVPVIVWSCRHVVLSSRGCVVADFTVATVPPPAGGAAVLTILNVMDLYPLTRANETDNLTYHRLIEVGVVLRSLTFLVRTRS